MKQVSQVIPHNIALARQEFLVRGQVQTGSVAEAIERSWRRCLNSGLDNVAPKTEAMITAQELRIRQQKNRLLLTHAEPEMLTLSEQISHTRSIVILTDSDGVILRSVGDYLVQVGAENASLLPGASWSETHRGTNAIGTALIEQAAISVQGAEHFMSFHHALSCSAVPIFGAKNQLLATLDVSNDLVAPQQHTLALVKMAAQMIENRLFRAGNQAELAIHFHARPEFIGTLWEGIAMFNTDGKLQAINRSGQFQLNLNLSEHERLNHNIHIEHLFDSAPDELLRNASHKSQMIFSLRLQNGSRVYARVEALKSAKTTQATKQPKRTSAASLEMLDSGDLQISVAIQQVKQVINREIPILILGETGVGKELFARAIHEAGERYNKPWVAVNCAALPEGLIEAELFGYEEGAFTGAKRKGSVGKIEQADGGTLFLDEIGDMPLSLQARLLRVLQERMVTPLGCSKAKPVDFVLVSATNQFLKEKVAKGEFRSDLYYRINGLSIQLPALRERQDLAALIKLILHIEQVGYVEFTPEAMKMLKEHPWPGNIRQLHNVLRTALALADGKVIDVMHFTQDFIDEINTNPTDDNNFAMPIGKKSTRESQALQEATDAVVRSAMQSYKGNISAVARQLGISRNTLYRKLKALGLA